MKLRKVMFEMKFIPTLSLLNKLLLIGEKLAPYYPEWETDKINLVLRNPEEKIYLIIESNRMGFSMDEPAGSDYLSKIKKGVQAYKNIGDLTQVSRVGIRFKYLKKVNFNFEELVEIMTEKIYNDKGKFILIDDDCKYSDLAYISNFKIKDFNVNFSGGPLQKKEIFVKISPAFREHFDETQEPECSIFMDIDCYQKDVHINNIFDIVREGDTISHNLANRFSSYISGGDSYE